MVAMDGPEEIENYRIEAGCQDREPGREFCGRPRLKLGCGATVDD